MSQVPGNHKAGKRYAMIQELGDTMVKKYPKGGTSRELEAAVQLELQQFFSEVQGARVPKVL